MSCVVGQIFTEMAAVLLFLHVSRKDRKVGSFTVTVQYGSKTCLSCQTVLVLLSSEASA